MSSDSIRSRTLKLDEGQALAKQLGESLRGQLRPALIVISGQSVGERVSVQGNVLIGRDPSGQLILPDPGVSFRHAYIEDRGGSWVLVDLGSTNGTEVNGERTSEAPLTHGDKLRFGTTMVRFEVQDATDQAYSEAVAQLLNVDDLTGLYLRRRFDAELELLLSEARSTGTPLALLALDLDGVKAINDKHGHLFGAYTISESGKLLGQLLDAEAGSRGACGAGPAAAAVTNAEAGSRGACGAGPAAAAVTNAEAGSRGACGAGPAAAAVTNAEAAAVTKARGIGCRFGGDEYIAALPNHTLEQGASFGESIRQRVAQHEYRYDGVALKPGISIGVAEFPRHAQTGEALFRVADEALYSAKRKGKNRVECAP